ncbi:DEP domain-containing protein DDB_G0279099, partial [Rhagoletis pomonella]|uniref:DEP domain-containing protein DDB_G0279099 n=1 Tax=Rhagoletis pomonella TaxID=28610 RepID=UPI00178199C9
KTPFSISVLQNVVYAYVQLSPDHSPKTFEMLSNNLSPSSQKFLYSGHLHNDNDLNGIDFQLMSDDSRDSEAVDNRGNQNNDYEWQIGSEREETERQKYTKIYEKDVETTTEKEYLSNQIVQKDEERFVQHNHKSKTSNNNNNNSNSSSSNDNSNNNNNNSSNKTATKSSPEKQINLVNDKETMTTKSNAGVTDTQPQMRVKNDLHNVGGGTNETNTIRSKAISKTTSTTATQNTKPAALSLAGRNTIASSSNSATTVTSSRTSAAQPSANTKLFQQPNGFLNPFGQLVAFFGNDQLHLQDYTFFFNAERHTVFQLHTNDDNNNNNTNQIANNNAMPTSLVSTVTANGGRVLNVVADSIGAVFGVNTPTTGTTAATTDTVAAASTAAATASNSATPLSPQIKVEEVQLYNGKSLRQSRFNPFNPTRILIHGWLGGANAGVYQTLVPAYLRQGSGNYNVFTVDWSRGAVADYLTASYRVKPVGKVLAKFIDFLQREAGIRYEDLHVIGFSMGAHIAGIAGKHIQTGRLPVIYALDPALPFFRYENFDERIAITDADYIEVVHTSVGSYGYDRPLGHVDYYVNYGSAQPGCFLNECSHIRAFQIFAESLLAKEAFRAQGCDVKLWPDMIKHRRCLMGTGKEMLLGGDPANVTALRGRGGVFYLATNAGPPYAKDVT